MIPQPIHFFHCGPCINSNVQSLCAAFPGVTWWPCQRLVKLDTKQNSSLYPLHLLCHSIRSHDAVNTAKPSGLTAQGHTRMQLWEVKWTEKWHWGWPGIDPTYLLDMSASSWLQVAAQISHIDFCINKRLYFNNNNNRNSNIITL